jgi:hypothetical protein
LDGTADGRVVIDMLECWHSFDDRRVAWDTATRRVDGLQLIKHFAVKLCWESRRLQHEEVLGTEFPHLVDGAPTPTVTAAEQKTSYRVFARKGGKSVPGYRSAAPAGAAATTPGRDRPRPQVPVNTVTGKKRALR